MPRKSTRQSLQNTKKRETSPLQEGKAAKKSRPAKSGFTAKKDDSSTEDQSDVADDNNSEFEEVTDHETASDASSQSYEEDDYTTAQSRRRSKGPSKAKAKQNQTGKKGGSQVWRNGDELPPPGVEVITKKPQARAAGKTPYSKDTIHPNTFLFLQDLKINNNREWMKMHDPDYRASLNDWNSIVEVLTEKLCNIDSTVPELPVKDLTFRIYRDVRFSPNKQPYKEYFSAAWSRTGRKGPYAHYYVQIYPGNNSFVGGGLWHPEAPAVAALRRDIDRNPQRLKDILMMDGVRRELLSGAPKDVKKAVKAFVSLPSNRDSALKTKPKGYDSNHPDIELLRLKSFTVGRKLDDSEVLDGQGFVDRVANLFSIIQPVITCLNRIVLPDPGEEEDEDEEDEDDDDDDQLESETSADEA